jgi:hypothetical protein
VANREVFIGIDAAKLRDTVAIAEAGRKGEIRYLGEVDALLESMHRFLTMLRRSMGRPHCCMKPVQPDIDYTG